MLRNKSKHDTQAAAFITSLHETGWHSLNQFVDGGHSFELLSKGAKTVLVQIYPATGFQVWKGNVANHTTRRLDSFVDATVGKRLTYKRLIA